MGTKLIALPVLAIGIALAGCGGSAVENAAPERTEPATPAPPPPDAASPAADTSTSAAASPARELLSRDGSTLYVVKSSDGETAVLALEASTRTSLRTLRLEGTWELSTVAADGSVTGLSADGRTLVLQKAPDAGRTRFLVVDTSFDARPKVVALRGRYTLDAVAVDGSAFFLVRYANAVGDERYDVVSYDLLTGHLSPPLVDKRDPEKMQGLPLARLTSPAGDWAYTLYGGEHAFVHALPLTRKGGVTYCIDLEGLPAQAHGPGQRWLLTLSTNGRRLTAVNPDAGIDAVVDLVEFIQVA
jgi:hypothetical protein